MKANWNYPTPVRFGAGRIAELAEACKVAGMSRPLLVTDPGLAGLPMIAAAVEACKSAGLGIAVFSALKGNPVESNVYDGLKALKAGNHDGVIAFGGGSALDVGKVIAFMAGQTRPMWDFEDIGDWWTRADPAGILPIVAVPTTAGTGSEVGRAGVITQEATHTKKVIFHPKMMPAVVISDPELSVGLPASLTAWTGMDALAHCLEAYCAPGFHPMAEGIAVEGIRLVKEYLPRAVRNGKDIEARGAMLAAASMGAAAFQKGLGGIHSLSHPVGALYDTHHGLTNAVFMPYVLVHNRAAIEEKIGRLAAWLGLKAANFPAFLDWVLALREELAIPATLAGLKVDGAQIDLIAEMAVVDPTAGGNPVPLTVDGCKAIFTAALEGKL
ncbi:iron-containing alcohol dehydrogenase [Radicibacter daui]|uniref:iron-containing alcohol dehydrogenase n=1 Tax=Radicibacter daui TaxID=3064829 RepID=UPI004046C891